MKSDKNIKRYLNELLDSLEQLDFSYEELGLQTSFSKSMHSVRCLIEDKLQVIENIEDRNRSVFSSEVYDESWKKSKREVENAIRNLVNHANNLKEHGEFKNALLSLFDAHELANLINNHKLTFEINFLEGSLYNFLGERELALSYLNNCQNYYLNTRDPEKLTYLNLEKALLAFNLGDYLLVSEKLESVIFYASQSENLKMLFRSKLIQGRISAILESSTQAIHFFEEILKITNSNENPEIRAESYYNIGKHLLEQGELNSANRFLDLGTKLCEDHQLLFPLGFIGLEKSRLYLQLQRYTDAFKFVILSLEIFIQSEDFVAVAHACLVLAENITAIYENEQSIPFYQLSIEIFQDYDFPFEIAMAYTKYAYALMAMEMGAEAVKHYQVALNIFEKLNLPEFYEKINNQLLEYEIGEPVREIVVDPSQGVMDEQPKNEYHNKIDKSIEK